jgi:predicted secreted hydrolase
MPLMVLLIAALLAVVPLAQAPFRQALPGYRFEFPRDHFAHPDFQTEWWYYTGNLRTADGRQFGFELTFFRQAVDRSAKAPTTQPSGRPPDASSDLSASALDRSASVPDSPAKPPTTQRQFRPSVWDIGDVYLAHFAMTDIEGRKFHHDSRVNRPGPGVAGVDAETGSIWNGNWSTRIEGSRHSLQAIAARFRIALDLDSQKPPVINGLNGVSQKAEGVGQASHYVSLTRLVGKGTIEFDGARFAVDGSAWMDHEFFTNQLGRDQRGWDWLGLQLDDGSELMVYRLRRSDGTADPFSAGTVIAADGRVSHLRAADFSMTAAGETWSSPASRATYPIAWRVTVPSRRLDLTIRTPLPSQELIGRRGFTPTYWEGSVRATGTRGRSPATGVGYLEMTGYDKAVVLGGR